MHRDEVELSELAIDVGNEFADLSLKLGRVRERGRGDLDKHNVPDPLRVLVQ